MNVTVEVLNNAYPLEVKDLEEGKWYQCEAGGVFFVTEKTKLNYLLATSFRPSHFPKNVEFNFRSVRKFREMQLVELTLKVREI